MNRSIEYSRCAILAMTIGLALLPGCGTNTLGPNSTLSGSPTSPEDDVADVIAAALGNRSTTQGLGAELVDAVTLADGGALSRSLEGGFRKPSSVAFDTSIVRIGAIGGYSWNYTFNFHQAFLSISIMEFDYSMKGVYDIPVMSSSDSASAHLTVSDIGPGATKYQLNGTYIRLGSQTSKLRNKSQVSTTLSLILGSLQVDRATGTVLSGILTGSITGDFSGNNSFSWNVQVTFPGNGTAGLTVNGKDYTVNLTTARVI